MSSRGISMIAVLALSLAVRAAHADGPAESPQQLIKDVIFNELTDHRRHGYFEYLDTKRTGQQTTLKAEVETSTGRIQRLLAEGGKPLSPEQQEQETRRLEALLQDSGQQQKLLRDYQGDEDRIARIVGLMPEGFIYQYDGVEGDDIRLKYRPNPDFKPPTYEARVFHGMAGTVWINAKEKRLSRLQGQLVANVDFGDGLLGRLDKGGSFDMERVEVVPGNWKHPGARRSHHRPRCSAEIDRQRPDRASDGFSPSPGQPDAGRGGGDVGRVGSADRDRQRPPGWRIVERFAERCPESACNHGAEVAATDLPIFKTEYRRR